METMSWGELLFSFRGRIGRRVFWLRWMIPLIILQALAAGTDGALELEGTLSAILNLVLLYPGLAVNVKRCHDRARSGWFVLIPLIPVVGIFWYFVEVGCLRGTAGDNRFGPDPLGDETAVGPSLSA